MGMSSWMRLRVLPIRILGKHLPYEPEQLELGLMTWTREAAPQHGDGAVILKPKKIEVPSGDGAPTISVKQAAVMLRRSVFTIYRWCGEGVLEFKQIGRGYEKRVLLSSALERKREMEEVR